MRPEHTASIFVVVGLALQGYGLYEWQGLWCPLLVIGTEVALVGLAGSWLLRHVE